MPSWRPVYGLSLITPVVGQADVALLPVDCVSHSAALLVKRLCHEAGKRFLPLRAASLASFLAWMSLRNLGRDVDEGTGRCLQPHPTNCYCADDQRFFWGPEGSVRVRRPSPQNQGLRFSPDGI